MKKTILGIGIASLMTFGMANADVVDNDIDQDAIFDLQVNSEIDLNLFSAGDKSFDGTNVVNMADLSINNATDDARSNDVTQVAAFVGQGNVMVSGSLIDGYTGLDSDTKFKGVNVANYATVDIDALDNVEDNEVKQAAAFLAQGNHLIKIDGVHVGNTRFDGANIANFADVTLVGDQVLSGDTEEVDGNDVTQAAFFVKQNNGVFKASGLDTSSEDVEVFDFNGVNVLNYAIVEIDAEDADGNDIKQYLIGEIDQINAIVNLDIDNTGRVVFDGQNIGNFADSEIDLVFGGGDGTPTAYGNDIEQEAEDVLQVNSVIKIGYKQDGKITFDGLNAVNIATLNIDTNETGHDLKYNDIDQDASDILQINSSVVAHGIHIGDTVFVGTNVVNQADLTLFSDGDVMGNDLGQTASGINQINSSVNIHGLSNGTLGFSGTNLINVGSVTIAP